jgi:two-component system response regulator AtoC
MVLGFDDEARRALHVTVAQHGYEAVSASDVDTARKHLSTSECDVVLASPELAAQLAGDAGVPLVIAVASGGDAIVDALRSVVVVPRAKPAAAAAAPARPLDAPAMIGDGSTMQRLRSTIALVAQQRTTVLVLGESGTGKELVARAIHAGSPRRERAFVAVNCAAIPPALLESMLFGHMRGAFTDAVRDHAGLFEEANGGTLFLDEVGELPAALQAKLLRALQDSEIRRVGATEAIKLDIRLITATLRDLAGEVAAGRFREDLYYRLNVVPIEVPPLRQRVEDIPQLARHFVAVCAGKHGRDVELTDAALGVLAAQPWPGNVRELENIIERAVVLAESPQIDSDFLATLVKLKSAAPTFDEHELSIKKATRSLEQDLIRRALGVTQGNRTNAAKLLEISHRALLYKMKEYGIS